MPSRSPCGDGTLSAFSAHARASSDGVSRQFIEPTSGIFEQSGRAPRLAPHQELPTGIFADARDGDLGATSLHRRDERRVGGRQVEPRLDLGEQSRTGPALEYPGQIEVARAEVKLRMQIAGMNIRPTLTLDLFEP